MTSGWPLFAVLAALKGFMGVANGEELPELRSQTHPNTRVLQFFTRNRCRRDLQRILRPESMQDEAHSFL